MQFGTHAIENGVTRVAKSDLFIADLVCAFRMFCQEHRSAWTLELDLRPYKETF